VLSIITEKDDVIPASLQQAFVAALPAGKSKVCVLKNAKHFETLVLRFDEAVDCAMKFLREKLPVK
jgi:hypothetical protein